MGKDKPSKKVYKKPDKSLKKSNPKAYKKAKKKYLKHNPPKTKQSIPQVQKVREAVQRNA
jgi:hypothetical protein